jgi:hypothetical protein
MWTPTAPAQVGDTVILRCIQVLDDLLFMEIQIDLQYLLLP